MVHSTTIRVRFSELDPYNHVNHAVYATYFEAGRVEALESVGMGLDTLAGEGWQVVVTELRVRFKRAAGAGDVLTVETSVGAATRATTTWHQVIRRAGELMADAEVTVAVTDRRGRPVRPPDRVRDGLRQLGADF
ncbi:MAG: acyl-CoA thioesterase [Actinomycetia bacterium]|nr:acyl-CoA thioesterase [Actinomycetes bacterium]